jgi:hypothetical protein
MQYFSHIHLDRIWRLSDISHFSCRFLRNKILFDIFPHLAQEVGLVHVMGFSGECNVCEPPRTHAESLGYKNNGLERRVIEDTLEVRSPIDHVHSTPVTTNFF